jgi:hypothetical protein
VERNPRASVQGEEFRDRTGRTGIVFWLSGATHLIDEAWRGVLYGNMNRKEILANNYY